jgi:restriction system protein
MDERSVDVNARADTWSGYLPLEQPERSSGLITPQVVHDLVRRAALPSLVQRIESQKFAVSAPTVVLPRQPTLSPIKVAPPKRTRLPEEPPFTAPSYSPGIIGRLIPKIGRITHAGLIRQARELHARAVSVWRLRCEEIARDNEAEESAYEQRLRSHPLASLHREMLEEHQREVSAARASFDTKKADWANKCARFDQAKDNDLAMLAALANASARGDADSIAELVRLHLLASSHPAGLPRDYIVRIDREAEMALLEVGVPDFSQVVFHKLRTVRSGTKAVEVGAREARALYDKLIFGFVIRHLIEAARVPVMRELTSVALNGMIRRKNPATGNDEQFCAVSLCTSLQTIMEGIAVAPVVSFDRADSRLVPGRAVAENLGVGANLADMDWDDFEHLVRQLFELEFRTNGSEVKVTRSSRDRGVDAIVFDPDPLRGGKIVIQAKRYNSVVDVSAVRDLFGTVQNEGANRGLLVTTSHFGRDSYDFAAGKNITLIDGGNLLHLFRKHGFDFRIKLKGG